MTQVKIYLLTWINDLLLLVFYSAKRHQFRVANARGEVVRRQGEIYYTTKAAEREGRHWIAVEEGK